MDRIDLKKYYRVGGLVDKQTFKPTNLLNKMKSALGNVTFTKKGLIKTPRVFDEFFINDKPLSSILEEFYCLDRPIFENWIGILGSFSNKQLELNDINRLLLKQISELEILAVFPKDLDKQYSDEAIANYKEELADEEIMIYSCAECGDYQCGGIKIKVDMGNDFIVWTLNDEGKVLQFRFDKNQYFKTFNDYRKLI